MMESRVLIIYSSYRVLLYEEVKASPSSHASCCSLKFVELSFFLSLFAKFASWSKVLGLYRA
jgi:hypothetical protein